MNCANCGLTLKQVFDLHPLRRRDDFTVQYDGALAILFEGGYGMFFDDIAYAVGLSPDREHTAILCKDCAQKLIEQNPWISNFIKES